MLRAARFLEKSFEAELAALSAETEHARTHFAELARAWRRMAEECFEDNLPGQLAA
jgi:hypothetical protein